MRQLLAATSAGTAPGSDLIIVGGSVSGMPAVSNSVAVPWAFGSGSSATQPPPVILNPSPADGTIVTKPTPITAQFAPPSGQTIASWSVSYQELDPLPPVTLASGICSSTSPQPCPPATLASFDPTLLPNDTYAITISATASGGGTQSATTTVAVFGNLKLGRYVTTYQDLSVPVNGFLMQVRRV